MSSFRSHRIVIASLFLPETAAIGEISESPTPIAPPIGLLSGASSATPRTQGFRAPPTITLPPRSIVDDLTGKVRFASNAFHLRELTGECHNVDSSISSPKAKQRQLQLHRRRRLPIHLCSRRIRCRRPSVPSSTPTR